MGKHKQSIKPIAGTDQSTYAGRAYGIVSDAFGLTSDRLLSAAKDSVVGFGFAVVAAYRNVKEDGMHEEGLNEASVETALQAETTSRETVSQPPSSTVSTQSAKAEARAEVAPETGDFYTRTQAQLEYAETAWLQQLEAMLDPLVWNEIAPIMRDKKCRFKWNAAQTATHSPFDILSDAPTGTPVFYYQNMMNLLRDLQSFLQSLALTHREALDLQQVNVVSKVVQVFSTTKDIAQEMLVRYRTMYETLEAFELSPMIATLSSASKTVNELKAIFGMSAPNIALQEQIRINPVVSALSKTNLLDLAGLQDILDTALQLAAQHVPLHAEAGMTRVCNTVPLIQQEIKAFSETKGTPKDIVMFTARIYPKVYALLRYFPQSYTAFHRTLHAHLLTTAYQLNKVLQACYLTIDRAEMHYGLKSGYLLTREFYKPDYAIGGYIQSISVEGVTRAFYDLMKDMHCEFEEGERFPYTRLVTEQRTLLMQDAKNCDLVLSASVPTIKTLRQIAGLSNIAYVFCLDKLYYANLVENAIVEIVVPSQNKNKLKDKLLSMPALKTLSQAHLTEIASAIKHTSAQLCGMIMMLQPPTEEIFNQLPAALQGLYVRSGDELLYLDTRNKSIVTVRTSIEERVAFDAVVQPIPGVKRLVEDDLKQMTLMSGHVHTTALMKRVLEARVQAGEQALRALSTQEQTENPLLKKLLTERYAGYEFQLLPALPDPHHALPYMLYLYVNQNVLCCAVKADRQYGLVCLNTGKLPRDVESSIIGKIRTQTALSVDEKESVCKALQPQAGFALRVMNMPPTPDHLPHGDKSTYVLLQSTPTATPSAVYFVDRNGVTPVISEPLTCKSGIDTLLDALYPSADSREYADIPVLSETALDAIKQSTDHVAFVPIIPNEYDRFISKEDQIHRLIKTRIAELESEIKSAWIHWTETKHRKIQALQALDRRVSVRNADGSLKSMLDREALRTSIKHGELLFNGRTGKVFDEMSYLSATRQDECMLIQRTYEKLTQQEQQANFWFFAKERRERLIYRRDALARLLSFTEEPGVRLDDALDKLRIENLVLSHHLETDEKLLLDRIRNIEAYLPDIEIGKRVIKERIVAPDLPLREEMVQLINSRIAELAPHHNAQYMFFGLMIARRNKQLEMRKKSLERFKEWLERDPLAKVDRVLNALKIVHSTDYDLVLKHEQHLLQSLRTLTAQVPVTRAVRWA